MVEKRLSSHCIADAPERRTSLTDIHVNLKSRSAFSYGYRSSDSPGYWLCTLLPTALALSYYNDKSSKVIDEDVKCVDIWMISVIGLAMSLHSFILFFSLRSKKNLLSHCVMTSVSCIMTTAAFYYWAKQAWPVALLCSFYATIVYHFIYLAVMYSLPQCCTPGEASIVVQGILLFCLNALWEMYNVLRTSPLTFTSTREADFRSLKLIMMSALIYLLIWCVLLAFVRTLRQPRAFYIQLLVFVMMATSLSLRKTLPIVTVMQFIARSVDRIHLLLFYIFLIFATASIVSMQLFGNRSASTSTRKIFHILIVLVYLPGFLCECRLLYLATGVAFTLMVIVELMRILQIPPMDEMLERAFGLYADSKDTGLIAFTPFCLLIGCSLPIWLMSCPQPIRTATCAGVGGRLVPLSAGIITIGFGDTAASIIGSKYGRHKWRGSSRSVEGTLAFMLFSAIPLLLLDYYGYFNLTTFQWIITSIAIVISSWIEARTSQIDNLVLPLIFYNITRSFF